MTLLYSLLLAVSSLTTPPPVKPEPVLIDVQPDHIAVENLSIEPTSIKPRKFTPCIYDLPYSWNRSAINKGRLLANTGILFGAGATMLGILQIMPEDATAWNKSRSHTPTLSLAGGITSAPGLPGTKTKPYSMKYCILTQAPPTICQPVAKDAMSGSHWPIAPSSRLYSGNMELRPSTRYLPHRTS